MGGFARRRSDDRQRWTARTYRWWIESMHLWARSRGWSYQERDPALARTFTGEPFNYGPHRAAWHVFRGRHRGYDLLSFHYPYRDEPDQEAPGYVVTAVATPAARPTVQVSQETTEHRLLELAGIRDVQFESDEFNRVFRVAASDEKFAYDVLNPRLMEFLLTDPRARHTPFRFEGAWLLCWGKATMDQRYAVGMADFLGDILDRVPAFVWR